MKPESCAGRLPVYDRALAIRVAGGNPRVAAELLGLLLGELPDERQALRRAWERGDKESVRKLAHKLHGSARYCGTPALAAAAAALEAVPPEDAGAAALFERLLDEIRRLLETPEAGDT